MNSTESIQTNGCFDQDKMQREDKSKGKRRKES